MASILLFLSPNPGFGQSVWFEPNRGQVAGQTQWVGRAKGAYLYITGDEVVYANQKNVHMKLVGASKRITVEGMEPTGGYSNYFTGRDEKTWFTGIPHYAKLRYKDVYPGIDMVYYGTGRNVEYDFVVHAGADAERIELAFSEPVKLEGGDVLVAGMRQHRPRVQQSGRPIAAEYRVTDEGHVQIALTGYDRSRELTVDPVLEFSTFLGGPGQDYSGGIALDAGGNIVICGGTQSPATPGLNPFQQTNISNFAPFVIKMNPTASKVLFFTVIGISGYDNATSLVLDSTGLLLAGSTRSANFPLKNAFQTELKAAYDNAFVMKLSPDGKSILYSSYYGGSYTELSYHIAADLEGNAYITGITESKDIPIKNALISTAPGGYDCYFAKVSPAGALLFSTYLGGSGSDFCGAVAVAPDGSVYIAGGSSSDDFPLKNPIQTAHSPRNGYETPLLMRISADGQAIQYASFLGGVAAGRATRIAFDSAGNIYLAGDSDDKLVTKNAFQPRADAAFTAFLMKLDPSARNVLYSTYLGGSGNSSVYGLAVDSSSQAFIAGLAASADFPLKGSLQAFKGGGIQQADFFVAKFTASGSALVYSTLMGGTDNETGGSLALDAAGNAYFAGWTWSADFPVRNAYQPQYGGGNGDIALFKLFDNTQPPTISSPLTTSASRLTFRSIQGDPPPPAQTVSVSGGGFTASTNAAWATVTGAIGGIAVTVNASALPPGNYSGAVTLTPGAGTPATIDLSLNALAPAAVLASVEPAFLAIGAEDTTITIRGSRFTKDSIVQINGLPWITTPVQFVDSSTLKVSLPKGYFIVEYNHTVAVQNPQSPMSNLLSIAVGRPAPIFTAASVTNAASFVAGPIAPGEIVTIFGTNLDQKITFDDIPATVVFFSPTQISATVPYTVTGPSTILKSGLSVPVKLDVVPSSPGIFAAVADQGVLTLYATGCGALTKDDLPRCALPVSVTINDQPADVLYAGVAPGLPEGANQINVRVPDGVRSGPIRIVLKAGDAVSKEYPFTLP